MGHRDVFAEGIGFTVKLKRAGATSLFRFLEVEAFDDAVGRI